MTTTPPAQLVERLRAYKGVEFLSRAAMEDVLLAADALTRMQAQLADARRERDAWERDHKYLKWLKECARKTGIELTDNGYCISVVHGTFQAQLERAEAEVRRLEGVNSALADPSLFDQFVAMKARAEAPELAAAAEARRLDWLQTQGLIGIGHVGYGDYRHYAGDGFKPIREFIDSQLAALREGGAG